MTLSSLDLCGPDPKPMTAGEARALKSLVGQLGREPIIFQIGAYIGASTVAMLEERPGAFVVSVDLKPCPEERANVERAGLEPERVIRLLGHSAEVGRYWPWACDLLYIDGDHRYQAVRSDIEIWAPKVIAGGIIAFHDCYRSTPPPKIKSRVRQAVDEWQVRGGVQEILWTERLRAFKKF